MVSLGTFNLARAIRADIAVRLASMCVMPPRSTGLGSSILSGLPTA
jgi:hypothetical protein